MDILATMAVAIVFCALGFFVLQSRRNRPQATPEKTSPRPASPPGVPKVSAPSAPQERKAESIAVVDLETTGLDPESDRIIEICVFITNPGTLTHDGHTTLINPGRPLTPFITKLTGITDEMLEAADHEECLNKYFDVIGERTVFAYNADFDMSFLKAAAGRIGKKFDNPRRCIMELVKERHPNLMSYKLTEVCDAFNIKPDGVAHRAEYDCRSAFLLVCAVSGGAQPKESAVRRHSNDYGVYLHCRKDSVPFYVWTARDGTSTKPDGDPIWSFYAEKKLANNYEIRCIKNGLSLDDAKSMKSDLMTKHARTVLNRYNFARGVITKNMDRRDTLRASSFHLMNEAKALETAAPNDAIDMYLKALAIIEEYPKIVTEKGLFGEISVEYSATSHSSDAVKVLDRISLTMCRQGNPHDAEDIVHSFFSRYETARSASGVEAILRRIEKAKKKAPRTGATDASLHTSSIGTDTHI